MLKKGLLKGYSTVLNLVLRIIDFIVVLSCGVLSYYYSSAFDTYANLGVHGLPEHYFKTILLAVVIAVLLFPLFNVYRVWRGSSTLTEIKYLTMAWLMVDRKSVV